MKFPRAVVFTLCLLVTPILPASDYAKEKRWADEIADSLVEGDAVWLQAGEHRFLSIYTTAKSDKPNRGIILLHGTGVHPDWRQVIYPLRTGLAARGMPTLSLQMPVLPNEVRGNEYEPLIADADPRIEAGMKFLKEQGVKEIVLIGHSLGSVMAAHYLAGGPRDIKGFVGVNIDVYDNSDERIDTLAFLRRIRIPTLDIYGSAAATSALKSVDLRAEAAKTSGNKAYRQIKVEGANQLFDGKDDILLENVSKWLSTLN